MHVAYLVNQYPKVSHTFIRREILALEAAGLRISRFALRTDGTQFVDPVDAEEHAKTRYILGVGASGLLGAVLATLAAAPAAFLRALRLAIRLGRKSDRGVLRNLIYFAEACVLRGWQRQSAVDHVHAHFGTNSTTVVMLCRHLGGAPYSFTVHGPEEFDMPVSLALREKVHSAAFVVAISSFCRSQIFRWAAVQDWPKVHIVRCALDAAYFDAPTTPLPRVNRVVCVGRLSPEKGHLLLLQALDRVTRRGIDLELVLAGDGPLRSQLETQIAALGLQAKVRITGWINNSEVRALLVDSRALVLSSFAEGLPVVIMEACAVERPVIATHIAGIPELIQHGECGWLIPAGDEKGLADALELLARSDNDALALMGAKAKIRARRMHDVEVEAGKLAGLFAGRVETGRRSPE